MSGWVLCGAFAGGIGCQPEPAGNESVIGTTHQALSASSVHWEQKTIGSPPPRMGHALIYDDARGLTIAAGGRPVADTGVSLSDTWAWDGQSWASLAAGLPARGFISGTFDSARQISLIYGGLDQPGASPVYLSQILERGTGAWVSRSGFPGARSGAVLAYDAARATTLLFGGFDGDDWRNDIWEWDGSGWTERCNSAPCNLLRPSVRENSVFVYDPVRQVTLLFGGFGEGIVRGETWTWNGSTWSQRLPPTSPSARHASAAAYDPTTRRIFMFGGVSDGGETNELWTWDGTTWEPLTRGDGAGPRRDARLAWDTARRRGVLFGGRSGGGDVDFWEFWLTGNACGSDDECHQDTCIEAFCGGPPPEPELDAGAAGTGGSGGGGGSTGEAGAGNPAAGSGGDPSSGGTSETGRLDAGDAPPGSAPLAPAEGSPQPVASRGTETSYYACSSVQRSTPSSGNWFATALLLLLSFLRSRRARWPAAPQPLPRVRAES
jgi:hypothetical protein